MHVTRSNIIDAPQSIAYKRIEEHTIDSKSDGGIVRDIDRSVRAYSVILKAYTKNTNGVYGVLKMKEE